jgi:hypothetical protein
MEAPCLPDRQAGVELHRPCAPNVRIWSRRPFYWPSPSMSLVALAISAIVALAAWCLSSDRHGAGISLWDVSGAYAFIGFAAGMLSDPQQVLEF